MRARTIPVVVFSFSSSMKSELSEVKEKSSVMGGRYKHNQQLEELRHLQDRLSHEKRAWNLERESMEQDMEMKKKELARTQVRTDGQITVQMGRQNGKT